MCTAWLNPAEEGYSSYTVHAKHCSAPDTFVEVRLGQYKSCTATQEDTVQPRFNERFILYVIRRVLPFDSADWICSPKKQFIVDVIGD